MRRLQLIGRKRQPLAPKPQVAYPLTHLLGLPSEILVIIFASLDTRSMLALSLTCSKLNDLIRKEFLFKEVTLLSRSNIDRFNRLLKKSGNRIAPIIQSLVLKSPTSCGGQELSMGNIGSNYGERNNVVENDYVDSLMEMPLLKNLQTVVMVDIPPRFEFPSWTALCKRLDSKQRRWYNISTRELVPKFSVKKLDLSSESGWTIPLRSNLLWTFGEFIELSLSRMTIDVTSLKSTKYLYDAHTEEFVMDDMLKPNYASACQLLVLNGCSVQPSALKLIPGYFRNVKRLELRDLKTLADLTILTSFKNANVMLLDFGSRVFQNFLDKYSAQFDGFFALLCNSPQLTRLELIGVDFLNMANIPREPTNSLDFSSYKVCLFWFFTRLSQLTELSISLTPHDSIIMEKAGYSDWRQLLSPFIGERCQVTVHKVNGTLLHKMN